MPAAPQIPALAFSFAMLARLGPCEAGVLFFIPDPTAVDDSRAANASPPWVPVDGLAMGFPSVAEFDGVLPPYADEVDGGCDAWTVV